jgi:hypothetical protein
VLLDEKVDPMSEILQEMNAVCLYKVNLVKAFQT